MIVVTKLYLSAVIVRCSTRASSSTKRLSHWRFLSLSLLFCTLLNRHLVGGFVRSSPPKRPLLPCMKSSGVEDCFVSRREALATTAAAFTAALPLAAAQAQAASLETIQLGDGQWVQRQDSQVQDSTVPASFSTYSARFLIHYDSGVQQWWSDLVLSVQLLSPLQQQSKMGRAFGSLAKSLEQGFIGVSYNDLYDDFTRKYGSKNDANRQIALLFTVLPPELQPISHLKKFESTAAQSSRKPVLSKKVPLDPTYESATTTTLFGSDLTRLLPAVFHISRRGAAFTIEPTVTLYEVGIGEEFGQTAVATAFGPLASVPLIRDKPSYSPSTYGLLGAAGATGCALTHSVVIPLDVVKTRTQTDSSLAEKANIVESGVQIFQEEGMSGLLLGAQATLVGYFWYGVSVYPSYAFFKRLLSRDLYPIDYAMAHTNEIALVAGALASVIASLGLTPLEAARIRVVADPDIYRPLGLKGTLSVIAQEDAALGWMNLYAGLPSLLTRQVIFGSIKFLAFEKFCELIFSTAPFLRDETWTVLAVSLVAGGLSGVLSSIVSQPADSVLTYVAKDKGAALGILDGVRQMVTEDGPLSLFRGLGSRCVWAGSIIAGQFLLYDVFRTFFGVNAEDLSQVFLLVVPQG